MCEKGGTVDMSHVYIFFLGDTTFIILERRDVSALNRVPADALWKEMVEA